MRKFTLLLLSVLLSAIGLPAFATSYVLTITDFSTFTPEEGKTYKIVNYRVKGGTSDPNNILQCATLGVSSSNLVTYSFSDALDSKSAETNWVITPQENGSYTIQNASLTSGNYLIKGSNPTIGEKGDDNSSWWFVRPDAAASNYPGAMISFSETVGASSNVAIDYNGNKEGTNAGLSFWNSNGTSLKSELGNLWILIDSDITLDVINFCKSPYENFTPWTSEIYASLSEYINSQVNPSGSAVLQKIEEVNNEAITTINSNIIGKAIMLHCFRRTAGNGKKLMLADNTTEVNTRTETDDADAYNPATYWECVGSGDGFMLKNLSTGKFIQLGQSTAQDNSGTVFKAGINMSSSPGICLYNGENAVALAGGAGVWSAMSADLISKDNPSSAWYIVAPSSAEVTLSATSTSFILDSEELTIPISITYADGAPDFFKHLISFVVKKNDEVVSTEIPSGNTYDLVIPVDAGTSKYTVEATAFGGATSSVEIAVKTSADVALDNARDAVRSTLNDWNAHLTGIYKEDIIEQKLAALDGMTTADEINAVLGEVASASDGRIIAFRNIAFNTEYLSGPETGDLNLSSTITPSSAWILRYQDGKEFKLQNVKTGKYIGIHSGTEVHTGVPIPQTDNISEAETISFGYNVSQNGEGITIDTGHTQNSNNTAQSLINVGDTGVKIYGPAPAGAHWTVEQVAVPTGVAISSPMEAPTVIPGAEGSNSFVLTYTVEGENLAEGFDAVEVTPGDGLNFTTPTNGTLTVSAADDAAENTTSSVAIASALKGLGLQAASIDVKIGRKWLTEIELTIPDLPADDVYLVAREKVGSRIEIPVNISGVKPTGLSWDIDKFTTELGADAPEGVSVALSDANDTYNIIVTGVEAKNAEQMIPVTLYYVNDATSTEDGSRIEVKELTVRIPAINIATAIDISAPATSYLDVDGNWPGEAVTVTGSLHLADPESPAFLPTGTTLAVAKTADEDNAVDFTDLDNIEIAPDGSFSFSFTPQAPGSATFTLTFTSTYGSLPAWTTTAVVDNLTMSWTGTDGEDTTKPLEKIVSIDPDANNTVTLPFTELANALSDVTYDVTLTPTPDATDAIARGGGDGSTVTLTPFPGRYGTVSVAVSAKVGETTYATITRDVVFSRPNVTAITVTGVTVYKSIDVDAPTFTLEGNYTPANATFDAALLGGTDGFTATQTADGSFAITGSAAETTTLNLSYGEAIAEATVTVFTPTLTLSEAPETKTLVAGQTNTATFTLAGSYIPDGATIVLSPVGDAPGVTFNITQTTGEVIVTSSSDSTPTTVAFNASAILTADDGTTTTYATLANPVEVKFVLPGVEQLIAGAATVTFFRESVPFSITGSYTPANTDFDITKLTATCDGLQLDDPTLGESATSFVISGSAPAAGVYTIALRYDNGEGKAPATIDVSLTVLAGVYEVTATEVETIILDGESIDFDIEYSYLNADATIDPSKITITPVDGLTFGQAVATAGNTFTIPVKASRSGDYTIRLTYDNGTAEHPAADVALTVTLPAATLVAASPDPESIPDAVKVTVDAPAADGSAQTAAIEFELNEESKADESNFIMTLPAGIEAEEGATVDFSVFFLAISDREDIATATVARDGSVTVNANRDGVEGIAIINVWRIARPASSDTDAHILALTDEPDGEVVMTITTSVVNRRAATLTTNFDRRPAEAQINRPLTFIAEADGGNGFIWSVDATEGVEIANPDQAQTAITFAQPGTYHVTVTVPGSVPLLSRTITVNVTVPTGPIGSGIEAINADAAAGHTTIHDLQGRRLSRILAPGLYIINGVKTLVR